MTRSLVAIAVLLLVGVEAAPQQRGQPPQLRQQGQKDPKDIAIISLVTNVNPDGSYQWSYETENGIAAKEEGVIKNAGNPETEALSVQGSFRYTADDGTPIELTYIADENGFQPQGAHLPTPPPIPDDILKSLEYNAAHPEEDESAPAAALPLPAAVERRG